MRGLAVCLLLLAGCGRDAPPGDADAPDVDAATAEAPATTPPAAAADAPPDSSAVADGAAEPPAEDDAATDAGAPAEAPEWTPDPSPPAGESPADTLSRADAAFAEGRLFEGADNALSLYLALLAQTPAHAEAQAGLERVLQALREQADTALAERHYAEARRVLQVLRRARAGDPALEALEARAAESAEVERLLADAQRLVRSGRVLEPAGANAAQRYAEVLQRDPGEPTALADLARLESGLVAQATAAAEAGDYAGSDRLLADAARLRPGSGTVQDASTRIVEMRQDRAGELLQRAYDAIDAGDVARAEQLQRQLEQVSAQSQGLEELRQRIAQARLYGRFGVGQVVRDPLASGGTAPEMIVVPVGRFEMGSPADESERKKNEGPRHAVTFRRGFAIARSEVSVAQFADFVAATGYVSTAQQAGRSTIYDERTGGMADRRDVDWRKDHAGRRASPVLPVVHVSWNDAKAYADWLSRETGMDYRLPSEAEFEYVLRAGSDTRYPWGDDAPTKVIGNLTGDGDLSATRRTWSNAFRRYADGYWGAAPVRSYAANAFGAFDVDSNVSEWIEDCWHDSYSRAPVDGSAWVNPGCARRVIRGASWASAPDQARAAFRINAAPDATNARVGFRVVREL